MSHSIPLLELNNISQDFALAPNWIAQLGDLWRAAKPSTTIHALDQVNLTIQAGEVLGLVGESGCGKSTLARIASGLQIPTSGTRRWKGSDVSHAPLSTRIATQMIFQDPYAALNPRKRVIDLVGEAALVHGLTSARAKKDYVVGLLEQVGLDASALARFAHQFSGGQRARIGIARALALQPELLVCDEAIAALDVSVQAQVVNLFMQLRSTLKLTYLFISHDLSVVRHWADRVAVMYLGRIIESAPTEQLFTAPNHPYTQALLAETPRLEMKKKVFVAIHGDPPSPLNPPTGCHFHPRCPQAFARCRSEKPALTLIDTQRWSACHLNEPVSESILPQL